MQYSRPVFLLLAFVFGIFLPTLRAQPSPPQTYSLTLVSNLTEVSLFSGREANVKIYRNGSKELVEVALAPGAGRSKAVQMRYLFDFQAHKAYTLDVVTNACSWMKYVSADAPVNYDPITGSAVMLADTAKVKPKVLGTATINGIPTTVEEFAMPGQGKTKIWLAEKGNFIVKLEGLGPDDKPIMNMEVKAVSYGKPLDSLFATPPNCTTQTQGEWSNMGVNAHAETSVEAQGSGSANLATNQTQGEASAQTSGTAISQTAANPAPTGTVSRGAQPAQASGRVTEVRLHEPRMEKWEGPCGSKLELVATITTSGPGTVWYRFLTPGGLKLFGEQEGTFTLDSAGPLGLAREVTFTESRSGQIRLEAAMMIGGGRHAPAVVSDPVAFHFDCRGAPSGTGGGATQPTQTTSRVTEVRLHLVPDRYAGPCPGHVQLVGDITTNGPGTVWYQFLAGAVSHSPEGTVSFTAAGTQTVTIDGTFRTTPRVPHASLIAIMEDQDGKHGPQNVSSGPVDYNITCTGQASPVN
jgi:hypothetical protein